MDYPSAKGLSVTMLGESHSGNAGRTVYGGGRNLWGSRVCPIPGKRLWELACISIWQGYKQYHLLTPHMLFCRRILSLYGTRQPATRPQQPGYAIRYEECSTYLPTPSWNIKHTPIASSTCGSRGRACCWLRACLSNLMQIARIKRSAHVCWGCLLRTVTQTAAIVASVRWKPNICVIIVLLLGTFGSNSKTLFFWNVKSRALLAIHPACHLGDGQASVGLGLDVFKEKIAVGGYKIIWINRNSGE